MVFVKMKITWTLKCGKNVYLINYCCSVTLNGVIYQSVVFMSSERKLLIAPGAQITRILVKET